MSSLLEKIAALKAASAKPAEAKVPEAVKSTVPDVDADKTVAPTTSNSVPASAVETVPAKPAPSSLPQINSIVKQQDIGDALLGDIMQSARGVVNQLDVTQVAHAEVRDTIKQIEGMLGNAHPMLPMAISKTKRIISQHQGLAWELTMEEMGIVAKACMEASKIVMAEKSTKARVKKGNITEDDML